jgi:hypothetical protein
MVSKTTPNVFGRGSIVGTSIGVQRHPSLPSAAILKP